MKIPTHSVKKKKKTKRQKGGVSCLNDMGQR